MRHGTFVLRKRIGVLGTLVWVFAVFNLQAQQTNTPLPGTEPLTWQGDLASELVAGVDRFLLRELERSVEQRSVYWQHGKTNDNEYNQWLDAHRRRLEWIVGLRDPRVAFESPSLDATIDRSAHIARSEKFDVYRIRWPAFGDVHGEGLLLMPRGPVQANVVAIPDADLLPEVLIGLEPGLSHHEQFARRLADSGCRVVVPVLIDRHREKRNGRANLTNREFIYRSAYELGRHIIGYELQKILAIVDWFQRDNPDRSCGVMGWGEGGLLALYAGALDPRIDVIGVSGYFAPRETIWTEPIDRNLFGVLERFGDAELAAMIAPRALVIEACRAPELELPSGEGGAPGTLRTPDPQAVRAEFERARKVIQTLQPTPQWHFVQSGDGRGPFGSHQALHIFCRTLGCPLVEGDWPVERLVEYETAPARQLRQLRELDRHNQALLAESPYVRQQFMSKLDFSSLENYQKSMEPYRDYFRVEVIGDFSYELLPPRPRTRLSYTGDHWLGYEVVLDVFPDVFAYGILLVPRDIKPGDRRPVVVCQHGLEGRAQDVIQGDHPAYHDFAARLADRGFVTFAPQHLYIFQDRFRTLQRKANPLKKTLFSIMVPQHRQLVAWLQSLPFVDGKRIGFYGLSYGGKSAMRIPPLVPEYALSICSADFNEWVWKNASTRAPYSYVWTGEYEIFEFDLGSTFNYAEMAALIAPRPFMVERGHFDGVAPDETVAYEFAKVRHLFQARLGIPDRCAIEWFVGPHTIHGQGTFEFLHRHLNWPIPGQATAP